MLKLPKQCLYLCKTISDDDRVSLIPVAVVEIIIVGSEGKRPVNHICSLAGPFSPICMIELLVNQIQDLDELSYML